MGIPPLTDLQIEAESRIRTLLDGAGRRVDARELRAGVVPFYSPDVQLAVKLVSGEMEVWIFDDEASFETAVGDGGFERYDHDSASDLLDALVRELADALSRGG